MKVPFDLPTETAIEAATRARAAEILPTVDAYEQDLITFISEHGGLAAQFALIIAVPVAFAAFEIGRLWQA